MNGIPLPDNKKLYVKEALKRTDREAERRRETIKYKSSKKRCNLYVKGFPETMTEDELRTLFQTYGEIESLKMHPPGEQKKLYAFVCFKKPDEASSAKENLTINDKRLTINHYEIKEIWWPTIYSEVLDFQLNCNTVGTQLNCQRSKCPPQIIHHRSLTYLTDFQFEASAAW